MFGKTKPAKEEFYGAKRPLKNCDVNVDNIVISKLIEAKSNFKYLIGCLDKVIRPLVSVLPEMNCMPLHIDGDKLLKKI